MTLWVIVAPLAVEHFIMEWPFGSSCHHCLFSSGNCSSPWNSWKMVSYLSWAQLIIPGVEVTQAWPVSLFSRGTGEWTQKRVCSFVAAGSQLPGLPFRNERGVASLEGRRRAMNRQKTKSRTWGTMQAHSCQTRDFSAWRICSRLLRCSQSSAQPQAPLC